MLQDIAILTNGTVISEDLGIKLDNVTLKDLGTAKHVHISKDDTVIVDGQGKKKDIKARVTAKSCKSVWPNSPAASLLSKSAALPKSK